GDSFERALAQGNGARWRVTSRLARRRLVQSAVDRLDCLEQSGRVDRLTELPPKPNRLAQRAMLFQAETTHGNQPTAFEPRYLEQSASQEVPGFTANHDVEQGDLRVELQSGAQSCLDV